jgi:hypothetical protein
MTPNPSITEYLAESLELAVGAVFLFAALSKLREPRSFIAVVRAFALVPRPAAPLVAVFLISVELALSIALVVSVFQTAALVATGAVILLFGTAVAVNLKRGRQISCGCLGGLDEQISSQTIWRLALLFFATSAALAIRLANVQSVPLRAAPLAYGVEVVATAAFLLVTSTWLMRTRQLIDLSAPNRETTAVASLTGGN